MKKLVLSLALLGALAQAAAAQDGGAPVPAPGGAAAPPPPPPPQQHKTVKEPSKAIATRIEEALKGAFSASAAGRLSARASLEAAIAEWAADAKDDPLRAVKWWRGMLAGTLPSGARHAGIAPEKYQYLEGKEATLWVSTPKAYGPKALSPMVLVILDKGEDPKRVLPAMYGELLKEWIVVAIVADAKEAGFDVVKEPWLTTLGLRFAGENLRVDRDRVVLDAANGSSNLALSGGSEWAVQFAGVILRGATASSPLVANLALGSVLVLAPDLATEPQKKVVEEVRAAVPGATFAASGKGEGEVVQKFLAAVPPRRIASAENLSFSWKTRVQGGEPWGYWFWVFRAADPKRERPVSVTLTRDVAGATVDFQGDNLAEGLLFLNDDLMDLDRDLSVRVNGKEVWKGKAERQVKTALYWIGQTGERTLFVPGEVRFTVPADVQFPKKDGAAPNPDGSAPPPPPPPPPPVDTPPTPPDDGKGGGDGGGGQGGGG
jgi:hypothetical protein